MCVSTEAALHIDALSGMLNNQLNLRDAKNLFTFQLTCEGGRQGPILIIMGLGAIQHP